MAEDDDKGGRTVRMYDRPADADKPASNTGRLVLIVVAALLIALLVAKFIFHVHLTHPFH